MQTLQLPAYPFELESREEGDFIRCLSRKKWLVLTPEEWVRQHWLAYLEHGLHYPAGRTAVEKAVTLGRVTKRYDIVVYNKVGKPQLLIECKAPRIKVNQKTLEQAARYNVTLQAPLLLISNGLQHFCLEVDLDTHSINMLSNIPPFEG